MTVACLKMLFAEENEVDANAFIVRKAEHFREMHDLDGPCNVYTDMMNQFPADDETEQVLGIVKGVQASLAKGYTGYTGAVRGDVNDELDTAERLLRNVFTKEELQRSVKEARDLLEQTRAVNAPGAGGAAQQGEAGVPQELDMSQLLRRMQDVCE